MSDDIRFSCILPTYNRCDVVEQTLRHLIALDYPVDAYEVIVADNSTDGTPEMVNRVGAGSPVPIRLLSSANRLPAVKRNEAIRMARGRYVVLMNDDLWVRPDFLVEHERAQRATTVPTAVLGHVEQSKRMDQTPFVEWYQPFAYHELVGRAGVPLEWLYFWSMNISVPRSELVGRNLMFHEDWAEIGSEDVELGWRWARAGNHIVYDPNAWGEHYHPHTLASACRLQESVGRGLRDLRGARRRRAPPAALRDPLHPQRAPRGPPPTRPDRPVQPVDRPHRPAPARLALRQQRPQPVDVLEGAALLHDPRVPAGTSPSSRACPDTGAQRRMSAVVMASAAPGRRIPRLREAALICGAAIAASGLSWVAASAGIKALVALAAVIGLVSVLVLVPNRSAVLQVGFVISLVVLQHKKFGPLVLNTESGANGLAISSADVMVVLLYISWMIEGTFKREVKRALRQPIYWVPLLGLALMSVSMFVASNVYLSISQIFYMLWPYLIFFYFGARLRTRRELLTVLVALGMFAVVELVVVILQWKTGGVLGLSFLGVPTQLQQRTLDIGAVGRPFGTIIHPVFLSDVLGMFALVALCVAIYVPDRRVKQAALLAVPICIAPIFLASARGPALALGVTMAVLIVFAASRRLITRRAILTTAGAVAVVGAAFYPKLSELVAENFGTHHVSVEITARLQLNDVAMRMLDSSPLIGTGLNNYTQIMNNFAPFPLLFPGYPAHNLYLLQLAETGFVGLFGMLFVAMALAKVGYDLLKSYHWLARTFGAALLCILLFNFGEEMLSYSLREEVPLAVFWLIAGLALAARRIVRDETRAARRAGSPGAPRPTAATATAERGLIRHVVVVSRDVRRRSARRRGRRALPVPAPRATRRPGAHRRPALSGGARPVARPGRRAPGVLRARSTPSAPRRGGRPSAGQPKAGPPNPARPVTPPAGAIRPRPSPAADWLVTAPAAPSGPSPVAGAPVVRRARSTPSAPRRGGRPSAGQPGAGSPTSARPVTTSAGADGPTSSRSGAGAPSSWGPGAWPTSGLRCPPGGLRSSWAERRRSPPPRPCSSAPSIAKRGGRASTRRCRDPLRRRSSHRTTVPSTGGPSGLWAGPRSSTPGKLPRARRRTSTSPTPTGPTRSS